MPVLAAAEPSVPLRMLTNLVFSITEMRSRSVTDPFRRGWTLHSDPIPFIGPGAACIGQAMLGLPETIEFVEISHIELVTRR